MTDIESKYVNNNLYGLFVECVEDISFDGAPNTDDDDCFPPSVGKRISRKNSTVFSRVFKAVEKINMCESTDSLTSFASMSSMSSSKDKSEVDLLSLLSPHLMIDAVGSLTLNNYGSTNSLSSMDYISRGQTVQATPDTVIQFFFHALEIFINKSDEDEGNFADFPKFC